MRKLLFSASSSKFKRILRDFKTFKTLLYLKKYTCNLHLFFNVMYFIIAKSFPNVLFVVISQPFLTGCIQGQSCGGFWGLKSSNI